MQNFMKKGVERKDIQIIHVFLGVVQNLSYFLRSNSEAVKIFRILWLKTHFCMNPTHFGISPERGSRFRNSGGFDLGGRLGTWVFPFISQTSLESVHMHELHDGNLFMRHIIYSGAQMCFEVLVTVSFLAALCFQQSDSVIQQKQQRLPLARTVCRQMRWEVWD